MVPAQLLKWYCSNSTNTPCDLQPHACVDWSSKTGLHIILKLLYSSFFISWHYLNFSTRFLRQSILFTVSRSMGKINWWWSQTPKVTWIRKSKFALSIYGHELCNTHYCTKFGVANQVTYDSITSLSFTFSSWLDHLAYLTFNPRTCTVDEPREAKQVDFFNSTTRLR